LQENGEHPLADQRIIHSFSKMPETPDEAGLVVLLAEVNELGETKIKCFIPAKGLIDCALLWVSKADESQDSDTEASSLSARRVRAGQCDEGFLAFARPARRLLAIRPSAYLIASS